MKRAVAAALVSLCFANGNVHSEPRHGLSAFGELKYASDFRHFDYANPDAPKGGRIVTQGSIVATHKGVGIAPSITFDTLNPFILKGIPPQQIYLLFDSLMERAGDEPDAVYGLVAKTANLAEDGMSVRFNLRPQASFADGSALTADDVVATFDLLKKHGHERYKILLRDVIACRKTGAHEVRYQFRGKSVRDLPMLVAGLPILSKAYYASNDFSSTTLKAPLGSGPYRVKDFKQGSFVSYERRDDYWAKDLPVNRGRYNFGEIKLLFFRDRTAELEALKAGALDLREEFTSKSWKTEYNFQAVLDGRVKTVSLVDNLPSGAQGFFINLRRKKFADIRTRQALDLAFDFEWSNKNLFYNLYKRTGSVFENSSLKANGLPGDAELALLEPYRAALGDVVFGTPYIPPVTNGSGQDRAKLRQATQLLEVAGWKLDGTRRVNDQGQLFAIEFLTFSPTFERIIMPYIRNLRLLGIEANLRLVEAAQYQERVKQFDFDIVSQRFSLNLTPGDSLASLYGSAAANVEGSYNLSGLANPAIDGLIEKISETRSRKELTTAARALDRVLRAQHFWVPHWYKGSYSIAHWNMFGFPDKKPAYVRGILDTWWIDAGKADNLQKGP